MHKSERQITSVFHMYFTNRYGLSACPIERMGCKHISLLQKSTDNLFDRELTFINCNNIITCTKKDFTKMLSNGSVVSLEGRLTDNDMKLVAQGVKKSITVPQEIKELFR